MMDGKERADRLEELLAGKGVERYTLEIAVTEHEELNTEADRFTLYRTLFGQSASLTVFLGGRKGSAAGRDLSDEALGALVDTAVLSARDAEDDPANEIAEDQGTHVFVLGPESCDMPAFYDRVQEAMDTVARDFPKVLLGQIIAGFCRETTWYRSSSGSSFETRDGYYDVSMEFAGHEGDRTTGLCYGGVSMKDLTRPVLDCGMLRTLLGDAEKSLHTVPVQGKFDGDVILTPGALAEFTDMLLDNFVSSRVILAGTSLWLDRIGEKVASEKVSVSLMARDERICRLEPYTADGYLSEDVTVLDHGVLSSHLLDLYTARKTGRNVTKNSSSALVFAPGGDSLESMVRSVKRGLLVGGFSGGEPGTNGEFSGVAKNSFYIEDGEIRRAVMETMISGNLQDIFSRVRAVSDIEVMDGVTVFPYLLTEGVVISGGREE